MLTIYKDGKIILKATDQPYTPTYEVEKLKENTPYHVVEENRGGLMNGKNFH